MSRGNATFIPDSNGLVVTFTTRDGGERTYHYSGSDALAILGGDDPARYVPDQNYGHGGIDTGIGEAADEPGAITAIEDTAADISEGVLDIGFIGL